MVRVWQQGETDPLRSRNPHNQLWTQMRYSRQYESTHPACVSWLAFGGVGAKPASHRLDPESASTGTLTTSAGTITKIANYNCGSLPSSQSSQKSYQRSSRNDHGRRSGRVVNPLLSITSI